MRTETSQSIESQTRAPVLEAFHRLFKKLDYAEAERYWSPSYIQHSAHIAPDRIGLFGLIESHCEIQLRGEPFFPACYSLVRWGRRRMRKPW